MKLRCFASFKFGTIWFYYNQNVLLICSIKVILSWILLSMSFYFFLAIFLIKFCFLIFQFSKSFKQDCTILLKCSKTKKNIFWLNVNERFLFVVDCSSVFCMSVYYQCPAIMSSEFSFFKNQRHTFSLACCSSWLYMFICTKR